MEFPRNLRVAAVNYYGIFELPSNKNGHTKPGGTEGQLLELISQALHLRRGKPTYMYMFFKLFGAMFNQSFDEDKFSNRFLVGIWWCFCYLLSVSYAAVIASLLVIPMYESYPKDFEDLAEFVRKGEYKVILPRGTAYTKDTLNSLKESHVYLGETALKRGWYVPMEVYNKPYIPPKTAVIGGRLIFYFKYGRAPLSTKYISDDVMKFMRNGVLVNKNFCCKKAIDFVIKRINEFGLFERIVNYEIYKFGIRVLKTDFHDEQEERGLSLDDLSAAFICLTLGYILSIITFIVERIYSR
ncbi:glutamate receptor ionotropic, delta-1 [Caerostris extrusa]|uniref:Glutamate receptor ionotropic, delta-1 n=1 Tax=Caerostris extrusa TaxID=172846 RepID=A0AAV4XQD1_CAEEX|nr:glutamate receptor ionotropic, delta-1 [Caerostris extrusa]